MNRKASHILVVKIPIGNHIATLLRSEYNINAIYKPVDPLMLQEYQMMTKRFFRVNQYLEPSDFELKIRKRRRYRYLAEHLEQVTIEPRPQFNLFVKFIKRLRWID